MSMSVACNRHRRTSTTPSFRASTQSFHSSVLRTTTNRFNGRFASTILRSSRQEPSGTRFSQTMTAIECDTRTSIACSIVEAQKGLTGNPSRACRRVLRLSIRLETINTSPVLSIAPFENLVERRAFSRNFLACKTGKRVTRNKGILDCSRKAFKRGNSVSCQGSFMYLKLVQARTVHHNEPPMDLTADWGNQRTHTRCHVVFLTTLWGCSFPSDTVLLEDLKGGLGWSET
jgi:hypothetical protein